MARLAAAVVAAGLAALLSLGAGPGPVVRVDTWDAQAPGPLDLAGLWGRYPAGRTPFKHPPVIVPDDGRPVLELATASEAMRIGRPVKLDLTETPWLVWDWKPLALPEGGDVRNPKRNDQTGRVAVMFAGFKGLLYVWDTTAPVGTEVASDPLEMFQRVLIVVRTGRAGLGQWHRERRDVRADYRRLFEEDPPAVKLIGLEAHSNDTQSHTAMRFGALRFEAR